MVSPPVGVVSSCLRLCRIACRRCPRDSRRLREVSHRGIDAAFFMRNVRELEPHFDAAQRAEQREVVEIAEMTNAKHFIAELAQPASERHVEAFEYSFSESHFAVIL